MSQGVIPLPSISVIGAGLAGCEAAWQAAERGVTVQLHEMRPLVNTPVHQTEKAAELVCSNSLGTGDAAKAPGLLKEELRLCGSLIMEAALETRVPAGQALAVDRIRFSEYIQSKMDSHRNITVVRSEITAVPDGPAVIATGPMTSPRFAEALKNLTGDEYFHFYDAVSPIVATPSLNMDKVFRASRYQKGDAEYLNCPFDRAEYDRFYDALVSAEVVKSHDDDEKFFEGCLPVEEIARRGRDTLRFGPMKPVGLIDPSTGREPWAVVQLRTENREAGLYNLVGFQTRLKWPEQRRVFSMIPGLEEAEFLRLGVMHRNIFINAPKWLEKTGQFKGIRHLFLAGQITGVEGYMESTASGLLSGINCARLLSGMEPLIFPYTTAIGSLLKYITEADERHFQPMNINFGLFPPLPERIKAKADRNKRIAERALLDLHHFLSSNSIESAHVK
ncbi:MAG: methylenetetrahydrofolate--tRNA-(uracil(54)-C(5))-methyltransferase (FADH(2)-oxidizing) TrmFO [Candidatus Xenobiia bacterium LiM19]